MTELPDRFQWRSSGVLIGPKADARQDSIALKDPSVVFHNGRWHVFASTADGSGYNLVYLSFADWPEAGAADQFRLDAGPIGPGYRAAPQVFYFAPQEKWYLVYQTGNASYSTTSDLADPTSWTAPRDFYPGMPGIVTANIGDGYWVDMWVICDDDTCYLFSSDDNGHLYRSQTALADFPHGFGEPVIAMRDPHRFGLYEACNVYRIKDAGAYLLLVEAIGSGGRRYLRSWTAPAIAGPFTPLAATEANPFAGAVNVTHDEASWTLDVSHGEMLRDGVDQTMTIDPNRMRYLYQGLDPVASGHYNALPWRLGLLTQVTS